MPSTVENIKSMYHYLHDWMVTKTLRFVSRLCSKKLNIPEQRVLILSPHPDDEIFGCAGLMQQLVRQEKDIKVVILTQGEASQEEPMIEISALVAKRRELTLQAAQIVGFTSDQYVFLDWGDGKLHETEHNERRKNELMSIVHSFDPQVIFLPHTYDAHSDHSFTSDIVFEALKNHPVHIRLMYYCVWLWFASCMVVLRLSWKKSFFLQMSEHERITKKKAMDTYTDPKDPFGMPYSGDLGLLPSICKWKKELFFEIN